MRLILGPVEVVDSPDPGARPGTVVAADAGPLVVAAGQGAVVLRTVQPAGKRMMPVEQFLRGHPVRPGDRFGPEQERSRPE
jgi:methionyl-tRNA formyltransferase